MLWGKTQLLSIPLPAKPSDLFTPRSEMRVMQKALDRKGNKATSKFRWLPELDRLLTTGVKHGPAARHDAINKVLKLVPELTRGDCWRRVRHLRRSSELPALQEGHPSEASKKPKKTDSVRQLSSRPWTPADDDKLMTRAGYEPVAVIAQRLGRSELAVRFRLGALGASAKVTDGWSLRALQNTLRVSHATLRRFIADGALRTRDPRVSAHSVEAYREKFRASTEPSAVEKITAALARGDDGYSWERAADLLGISVAKVQTCISIGQLKVVNSFVTDRAFQDFCKQHGHEFNMALIDPAIRRWLVNEYGVPRPAESGNESVSRAKKHALVMRACKCGRKVAGNAYFRHVKACQAEAPAPGRGPVRGSGGTLRVS